MDDVLGVISGTAIDYFPTVGDVNTELGRLHGDIRKSSSRARRSRARRA